MSEKRDAKIAVNTFFIKNNKLLLGKRKNCGGAGDWGMPGGHLEFGETLVDGMKREIMEEIGLSPELELFQIVNNITSNDGGKHYLHVNFLAVGEYGEPELKEPEFCEEWKWFDLDNLPPNIFIGHQSSIEAFFKKERFVEVSLSDVKYLKLHN